MAALRLLTVPVVAVVVVAGTWLAGGVLASTFRTSIGLTTAWFGLAFIAVVVIARRHRPLAVPALGAYLVPAVHRPQGAGDVRGVVGDQEGDHRRDLACLRRTAEGDRAHHARPGLGVLHPPVIHPRLGDPGQDAVDADPLAGVVGGGDADEP